MQGAQGCAWLNDRGVTDVAKLGTTGEGLRDARRVGGLGDGVGRAAEEGLHVGVEVDVEVGV